MEKMGISPQLKRACDCVLDDLLDEIVRQGPLVDDVEHCHLQHSRMLRRDEARRQGDV